MTIPTPTSNWSERDLKGRDFGRTAPAEPTSFAPAEAEDEIVTPFTAAERGEASPAQRQEPVAPRADDVWDAPLTTKADLGDPARDSVLNAPLTSSIDLRGDRSDHLLEAPLTSTLDGGRPGHDHLIDAPLMSSLIEDRPPYGERREHLADTRRDAVMTPVGPAMAAAPAAAATVRPAPERHEEPLVERRVERSRADGKWAWVAVPVGVAAVAGVGYLALSSGGTSPAPTEPTVNERLAMVEPAAPQALTGMGVSDLGAGAAAPAAAAAPPVQTVEAAPATAPAAPPVRARTTASQPASAPEAAPAITATAPEPVATQAVEPPPPPVSAPVIQTEPLITTEPLPLG